MFMKVRKVIEVETSGLGKKIKQARKEDSRTLTELAAAAGMTAANWYVIEAEEIKALPAETLERIQYVLGIDFGVRFDESDRALTAGGTR